MGAPLDGPALVKDGDAVMTPVQRCVDCREEPCPTRAACWIPGSSHESIIDVVGGAGNLGMRAERAPAHGTAVAAGGAILFRCCPARDHAERWLLQPPLCTTPTGTTVGTTMRTAHVCAGLVPRRPGTHAISAAGTALFTFGMTGTVLCKHVRRSRPRRKCHMLSGPGASLHGDRARSRSRVRHRRWTRPGDRPLRRCSLPAPARSACR
jgi:hypothetical protein